MFTKLILIALILGPITVGSLPPTKINKPVILEERVGIKPYTDVFDDKQLKCLTDNIYFEARNEKDVGKKAVAFVTLNRTKDNDYPNTICGVVYHKTNKYNCQFSWTCTKSRAIKYPDLYKKCKQIAVNVLMNYGHVPDVTKGATYFRRHNVRQHWERNIKVTFTTRNHVFYRI